MLKVLRNEIQRNGRWAVVLLVREHNWVEALEEGI